MNSILQLKGKFESRSNNLPGPPKLPVGKTISSVHLRNLSIQLEEILNYWEKETLIAGALVSVHYKQVIAKSNRLRLLLSENSKQPSEFIRGAKFVDEYNEDGKQIKKHVFTYYVSLKALKITIERIKKAIYIIDKGYGGEITYDNTVDIAEKKLFAYEELLAKGAFLKVVLDGFYVERFDIDRFTNIEDTESIVTIFKTKVETKSLLSKFGINIIDNRIIDETTIRLSPDEMRILVEKAPYLISMSVTDLSEFTKDDIVSIDDNPSESLIPSPNNEPIVGVIDTQFDESVYFSEWVTYINMLDPNIPLRKEDFHHGTAVTSIIVDGVKGNPQLDDGCGRFRVRHFGVATHGPFSSFSIMRKIREIVSTNRDIKVWNISLGAQAEIKENFISPEASELDKLQSEYDVIFVVAGTNAPTSKSDKTMKIGAPADSINSLVVNSVDFSGDAASYTRVGPVLSFFNKPDISYYGGDGAVLGERMVVCKDSFGASYVAGTSFAAPWITRKLAYLINVMGLSREVAKALLIDAAAGWNRQDDVTHTVGYGVVPIHIDDILHSRDDEIRFVISGNIGGYETYAYNLPVPVVNNAHPFYARATLAYFPICDRDQGVDYTSTELDIHFGRIRVVKGRARIESIDKNKQSDEGLNVIYEEDARKLYRKWDNIKHVNEVIKTRSVPRKAYDAGLWGISIKTKERIATKKKKNMPFGVVITLKEMNGINRIDDFIKLCMARNWLVTRLDVENQIEIYHKAEEELRFE